MRIIIFILIISSSLRLCAQDPVFTQFYASPTILNPAFAGSMNSTRFSAGYRDQWQGVKSDLKTFYASADGYMGAIKSGIGANIINQKEDLSGYSYTQINLLYSFHIQLNNDWSLFPGISFGYGFKQFNLNGLLFEDQIDISSGNFDPTRESFIDKSSISLFDLSAGIVMYHHNAWIGLSLKHLTNPDISFLEDETAPLETFISLHGGYRFNISESNPYRSDSQGTYLFLTGNYMHQGPYDRFDLGAEFQISRLFIGLLTATRFNNQIDSADYLLSLNPTTGLQIDNFKIGFSYDFPVSAIGSNAGTAEITMQYLLGNIYKRNRRWQMKN